MVFTFGLVTSYVLTIHSLFPTSDGNFIFKHAPVLDVHTFKKSAGYVVHLGLIHDMSLLRKQSWSYRFLVTDAKGEELFTTWFDPKAVGGLFSLNSNGSLKWDEDGEAITASISDFVYRYELSDI